MSKREDILANIKTDITNNTVAAVVERKLRHWEQIADQEFPYVAVIDGPESKTVHPGDYYSNQFQVNIHCYVKEPH